MEQVVDLAGLEGALDEISRGGVTGRYVVQLRATEHHGQGPVLEAVAFGFGAARPRCRLSP